MSRILSEQVTLRRLRKLSTQAATLHRGDGVLWVLGSAGVSAPEVERMVLFSTEGLECLANTARLRRAEAGAHDDVELLPLLAP